MLEVFLDAFNGKGFFHKGLAPNGVGPSANVAFIPLFGVDLPDPSGIPVAGCTEGYPMMEASEFELLDVPRAFEYVIDGLLHGLRQESDGYSSRGPRSTRLYCPSCLWRPSWEGHSFENEELQDQVENN